MLSTFPLCFLVFFIGKIEQHAVSQVVKQQCCLFICRLEIVSIFFSLNSQNSLQNRNQQENFPRQLHFTPIKSYESGCLQENDDVIP